MPTPPPGSTAFGNKAPNETPAASKDKKQRAPRKDYGYKKGAILKLTDKEPKFRGKRQTAYEKMKEFNGKSADDFLSCNLGIGEKELPRGWLRFFVTSGYAALEGGVNREPKPKPKPRPKPPKKAA
jgi:hypothetical protein